MCKNFVLYFAKVNKTYNVKTENSYSFIFAGAEGPCLAPPWSS